MPRLLWLAVLCVLAYAPSLSIPLLEDDFPNIAQARGYGAYEPWTNLLANPTFRLRTTSYPIMNALWSAAGIEPEWYRATSLLLHILATWLVYIVAQRWPPVSAGAFWAAAFFAIHEGHQEAVMWFSAINELLLFVFGIAALACWQRAEQHPRWHAPGMLLFVLALLSKESAPILIALFLLVRPRVTWSLLLYVLPAVAAGMSILQSRSSSFRFSDGSFSLTAPFWLTLPRGAFRLLWIWGLFALVLWFYRKLPRRPMLLALAWIALALIPYSFLTYGQNIPSRQVYLASAGLAMLVGLVYQSAVRPFGSQAAALVAAAILVYNVAPLWTKKKNQFIERAAPTTRLIQQARSTSGPIHVRCFPQSKLIGEEAVRLAVPEAIPRLIWEPPDSGCRSPE